MGPRRTSVFFPLEIGGVGFGCFRFCFSTFFCSACFIGVPLEIGRLTFGRYSAYIFFLSWFLV